MLLGVLAMLIAVVLIVMVLLIVVLIVVLVVIQILEAAAELTGSRPRFLLEPGRSAGRAGHRPRRSDRIGHSPAAFRTQAENGPWSHRSTKQGEMTWLTSHWYG